MARHPDRQTLCDEMKRTVILRDRLRMIFEWYKGMVDKKSGRLLYLYDPKNDFAIGDGEPIRDIAAIWDVEVLSAFLGCADLEPLIRSSLDRFEYLIVERDGYAVVAAQGESFSIAHSVFLALALIFSDLPDKVRRFTPLITGILRQQRKDGSYRVSLTATQIAGRSFIRPRRC